MFHENVCPGLLQSLTAYILQPPSRHLACLTAVMSSRTPARANCGIFTKKCCIVQSHLVSCLHDAPHVQTLQTVWPNQSQSNSCTSAACLAASSRLMAAAPGALLDYAIAQVATNFLQLDEPKSGLMDCEEPKQIDTSISQACRRCPKLTSPSRCSSISTWAWSPVPETSVPEKPKTDLVWVTKKNGLVDFLEILYM